MRSFGVDHAEEIPNKYVDWMKGLPLYLEYKDVLVTHAPLRPGMALTDSLDFGESSTDPNLMRSIIWNRNAPERRDKYQIFGHNNYPDVKRFADGEGEFAICVDTSGHGRITGIHWPSGQVYSQVVVD